MLLFVVAGCRDREVEVASDRSGFIQRSQQQLVIRRQPAIAADPDAVARDPLGNGCSVPRLETCLPLAIDAPVLPSQRSCGRRSCQRPEWRHWKPLERMDFRQQLLSGCLPEVLESSTGLIVSREGGEQSAARTAHLTLWSDDGLSR